MTERENKKIKFIINTLFVAIVLGIIYFFMKFVFFWILPFLIALGVCFMIEPIIKYLTEKLRWKRNIAAILIVTLVIFLVAGIAMLLSTTLFREIKEIFSHFDDYIATAVDFIKTIPTRYGHLFNSISDSALDNFVEFIKNYDYSSLLSGSFGTGALKFATSFLSSVPTVLIYTLITIISTYFSAVSFPEIKSFLLRQCSPKISSILVESKKQLFETLGKYLRSYFVLLMITFAELSIAFLIFGIKPAVTLAFLIALVDILPVFGVGTVLIPWSVIELILGNPVRAITLICVYLVITIIRQTLEPKIIGDHVGMLPIVTLFCIYLGLQLFGVLGMFVLPITIIVLKNLQDGGKIKIWK